MQKLLGMLESEKMKLVLKTAFSLERERQRCTKFDGITYCKALRSLIQLIPENYNVIQNFIFPVRPKCVLTSDSIKVKLEFLILQLDKIPRKQMLIYIRTRHPKCCHLCKQ